MSAQKTIPIEPAVAMRETLLKSQADERYYLNRVLELAQTLADRDAEIVGLKAQLAELDAAFSAAVARMPALENAKEPQNG